MAGHDLMWSMFNTAGQTIFHYVLCLNQGKNKFNFKSGRNETFILFFLNSDFLYF